MRLVAYIASVLIVALGLLHCAVTFFNYDGISFDAVCFLGSGVAIVLAGFMNVATLRDGNNDTVIWTMALITNILFLLGFSFASFMMRQPQVFAGTILFLATTIYSFVNPRQPN